jgi:hypothetical protein
MRSLILALAFAAPVCAVAATPTYASPTTTEHRAKIQEVYVTFVNHTSQEREVRVGHMQYKLRYNSTIHAMLPVGSVVTVYSNENSKVNGQALMQVSANDEDRAVFLQ